LCARAENVVRDGAGGEGGFPAQPGVAGPVRGEPPDHDDGGGRFDAAVEAEPEHGDRPGDQRRADGDPGHRHDRASGREARSVVLIRGVVRPYLRLAALRVNGFIGRVSNAGRITNRADDR
jgi:hypothetical protein